MKTEQYTILKKKAITVSDLAKKWGLSRTLLFELMIEKGIVEKIGKSKHLKKMSFGYTTQHVTRTAIYIYANRVDELFKLLKIPKLESWEKMCLRCKEVKHLREFNERGASCKDCLFIKKQKKSIWAIDESEKSRINPYFLKRGLKYD